MISQDYTEYYRLCAFRMDEPMAVSFLQSRGILPETVKRYQIGFDKNWIDPAIVQQAKESASAFHSVSVPAPDCYTNLARLPLQKGDALQKKRKKGVLLCLLQHRCLNGCLHF